MRYADSHCTYTQEVTKAGDHFYIYTGPCMHTGKPYTVRVPAIGLHKYRQGALIQDAFPEMSKDDREFLISGYSPEGWAQAFGTGEEHE